MKNKSREILEFERLKDILQEYASSPCGIEYVRSLAPNLTIGEALETFEKIRTIERIISKGTRLDFGGFPDIRNALARANAGAPLNFREIREVADFITAYILIYESISETFSDLLSPELLKPLRKQIYSMVDEEGQLRDDATPELSRIKEKIKSLRNEIYDSLNKILRRYESEGVLREPVITIRNGRFVLPLIANFKTDGIIHGYSKSSETVFVEPLEVVSIQNAYIRALEEEREEIERIRRVLSERIASLSGALEELWRLVGRLEFYHIVALFKAEYNCEYPEFSDSFIEIINGYHPLLLSKLSLDNTVPLNIYLAKRVFLVSGPNAGGKTVLLKTLGLFHLMAKAGIPVPAEKAVLIFPDEIFALGFQDEQDLLEGESSFTAYVKDLSETLNSAKEGDLVILDELISSTDPSEASGIAYAVLDYFLNNKVWVLGSTHLSTLKLLVANNSEMLVGSMEFDPIELRPTYRVRLGEIGVSHAFEIAERVGLSRDIINRAKECVQGEGGLLEGVILKLREKEALYEKLVAEYNERLEILDQKVKRAEKIAKEKALEIISDAKTEVEKLLKELRKEERRDKAKIIAKETLEEIKDLEKKYEYDLKPVEDPQLEKEYYIKPVGVIGILKEMKKDKALVQVGNTFMEVPLRYLYERG